nr:Chain A, PrP peptide [synthetic construct]4W5L_B Chain B, PrP peptide [synthetic construct]
GGYLLGS